MDWHFPPSVCCMYIYITKIGLVALVELLLLLVNKWNTSPLLHREPNPVWLNSFIAEWYEVALFTSDFGFIRNIDFNIQVFDCSPLDSTGKQILPATNQDWAGNRDSRVLDYRNRCWGRTFRYYAFRAYYYRFDLKRQTRDRDTYVSYHVWYKP